jgi:hypothetical protein
MWRLRLFTLLAAISLLLCVASVGLWIWSDLAPFMRGSLSVTQNHIIYLGPPSSMQTLSLAGFGGQNATTYTVPMYTMVEFSFWEIVAAFSLLPFIRSVHVRGKSDVIDGLTCGTCGYDLRASPDRCPECGTAVAGEPSPASKMRLPRQLNLVAGVSVVLFVVLVMNAARQLRAVRQQMTSNVITLPPRMPVPTGQQARVLPYSGGATVEFSYSLFGWRIRDHTALFLAAAFPTYWAILRFLRPEGPGASDRKRCPIDGASLP